MLRTSPEQFETLAQQGTHVPVVREVLADLDTPLSLFRKIDDGRTAFLLESVEGGEKWARYSFLGVGARAMFRAHGSRVEWTENGQTEVLDEGGDPLEILRDRLRAYEAVQPTDFPLPRFIGGAVGMIGYDWVRFVENIPDGNPDKIGLPDAYHALAPDGDPADPAYGDKIEAWAQKPEYAHLLQSREPIAPTVDTSKFGVGPDGKSSAFTNAEHARSNWDALNRRGQ